MPLRNIENLIRSNHIIESLMALDEICRNSNNGFRERVIILNSRLSELQAERVIGIENPNGFIVLKNNILTFIDSVRKYQEAEKSIQEDFDYESKLLINNSFPFVDRTGFRALLADLLKDNNSQIVFVKGPEKSGMTHLEKYLIHIGRLNELYNIIPLNIPDLLDDPKPFKAARLAKYMALALDIDVAIDDSDDDQFKFRKSINQIKNKINSTHKIPIFFMHDFHRLILIPDDIYRLIQTIGSSVLSNFPKSIFIFAGIEETRLPNWYNDLMPISTVYDIEGVEEEHVINCLEEIYDKFQDKLEILGFKEEDKVIKKELYINGMLREMDLAEPIQVTELGQKLLNHLHILKSA